MRFQHRRKNGGEIFLRMPKSSHVNKFEVKRSFNYYGIGSLCNKKFFNPYKYTLHHIHPLQGHFKDLKVFFASAREPNSHTISLTLISSWREGSGSLSLPPPTSTVTLGSVPEPLWPALPSLPVLHSSLLLLSSLLLWALVSDSSWRKGEVKSAVMESTTPHTPV